MKIAIVVGTVVASHKEPNLEGSRLLILKNVTIDGQTQNDYIVAVDAVGAGVGEYVLHAGGFQRPPDRGHPQPPSGFRGHGDCGFLGSGRRGEVQEGVSRWQVAGGR